jgi:hypothetical protein
MFFLKKEPKNFFLFGSAQAGASSRQVMRAPEQKFFASFVQKRRPSLLPSRATPIT